MKFSVVDVETTGLFPGRGDRVVEIAVVEVFPDGSLGDEFVSLVNPKRDIGPTRIHGLTSADVLKAPTFEELIGELLERLDGTVAMAAHNARFDEQFLRSEFSRSNVELPEVPSVCTMRLSGGGRLAECCCRLGVAEPADTHSALHDARAAAGLLSHFLQRKQLGRFDQIRWPKASKSQAQPITRKLARSKASENPYLSRIVQLSTEFGADVLSSDAAAYMAMLETALEDRVVTEQEAELLIDTASIWGLTRPQVEQIHWQFMQHMAVAALLDDVVTDAERRDLQLVAGILGFPRNKIDQLLDEAARKLSAAKRFELKSSASESLKGKSVCFTGELISRIGGKIISREQAHMLAVAAGLKTASSVTKKLDILVVADPNTQSGKAKKAREYGTRIMAESVFWKAIGVQAE